MTLGLTPPAVREKKCDTCSLLSVCLPAAVERGSARRFVDRQLAAIDKLGADTDSETNTR